MSTSTNPAGPLSVGNVVSAGVRIYRSHLRQYFTQALIAHLWIFVMGIIATVIIVGLFSAYRQVLPVYLQIVITIVVIVTSVMYGLAKYLAIAGLISRLAFGEIASQPETLTEARKHTSPRMWSFLWVCILFFLILIGLYFGVAIVFGILTAIGAVVTQSTRFTGFLAVILFLGVLFLFTIFFCRFMIVEIPLAIEPNLTAAGSIGRGLKLTQGAVGRIVWIALVAFLITLVVVYLPAQIVSLLLRPSVVSAANAGNTVLSGLLVLLNLAFGLAVSALILPFWQVIKAVIYYDLRARREGLGLELRNR